MNPRDIGRVRGWLCYLDCILYRELIDRCTMVCILTNAKSFSQKGRNSRGVQKRESEGKIKTSWLMGIDCENG